MKILYIHKAYFDKRPPIISTVEFLLKLNHQVTLITAGINNETKASLIKRDVDVYDFGEMPNSKWRKAIYYLHFRCRSRNIIKGKCKSYIIWIGSVDAAIAIGQYLFRFPYILQIQELYDKNKLYLKKLEKYMTHSRINAVPDNARALIFRSWFNLDTTPSLLPNKPFINNHEKNQVILDSNNAQKFEQIKNKKLILYQSANIRMNTTDIAQALLELGDMYVLGLLGSIRDKTLVETMLKKYPNVVHFDYMFAPSHLTLTSNAWVGVLTYNYESLNNVFCAPNKTWEFSAFGIPMLANNLPILKLQLEKYKAGETYEFGDIESIKSAIIKISNNYAEYCDGSRNLYKSANMEMHITNILDKMKNNEN